MELVQIATEILLPMVTKEVRAGKSVKIIVRGNSMNPFLVDHRDTVTISPFATGHPAVGDVILGLEAERQCYVLHRVVKIDGDGNCTLLGDGNVGVTELILRQNLIGMVTEMVRKGKAYTPRSAAWRCYSCIWKLLTPVRRYPLGVWRRLFLNRNSKKYTVGKIIRQQ